MVRGHWLLVKSIRVGAISSSYLYVNAIILKFWRCIKIFVFMCKKNINFTVREVFPRKIGMHKRIWKDLQQNLHLWISQLLQMYFGILIFLTWFEIYNNLECRSKMKVRQTKNIHITQHKSQQTSHIRG